MYTATNDSGNGPNLFGLIMLASEPFSTYLSEENFTVENIKIRHLYEIFKNWITFIEQQFWKSHIRLTQELYEDESLSSKILNI